MQSNTLRYCTLHECWPENKPSVVNAYFLHVVLFNHHSCVSCLDFWRISISLFLFDQLKLQTTPLLFIRNIENPYF